MNNLTELFEACGGAFIGDGVIISDQLESIDIRLQVLPIGIEFREQPVITFRVLIPTHIMGAESGAIVYSEYDVDFEIPLHAIDVLPKRSEDEAS